MLTRIFLTTFTILNFIATVASANSNDHLCSVHNQQNEIKGGVNELGQLFNYTEKDGSKKFGNSGLLEQGSNKIQMCLYYNNDPMCYHEFVGIISDYNNLFSQRDLLLDKYNSTKAKDFGITARINVAKKLVMVVEKDGSEQAVGYISGKNCDLNNPASYRRALASAYRSLILDEKKALAAAPKKIISRTWHRRRRLKMGSPVVGVRSLYSVSTVIVFYLFRT